MIPNKKLTPREQDVFNLYIDGLTQAEISTYLGISISSIKTYTSNILTKYEYPSISKLVIDWYKDQLHRRRYQ